MLWTWTGEPLDPVLAAAVRTEVAGVSIPGFSSVDWQNMRVALGTANDLMVSVQIQGSCDVNSDRLMDPLSPLGYVIEVAGTIEPTIFVNCRAIVHAIRPYILEQPLKLRYELLARAMVRVIRHELRHILQQTADHLPTGIYRACLQARDLIVQ
ncbi:MAG TPA: hypothetical protein VH351_19010 [Bryobacteraceae bacterium]|nr:hypothetical protein [Bryobacteraceae bacterium]